MKLGFVKDDLKLALELGSEPVLGLGLRFAIGLRAHPRHAFGPQAEGHSETQRFADGLFYSWQIPVRESFVSFHCQKLIHHATAHTATFCSSVDLWIHQALGTWHSASAGQSQER